MVVSGDSEEGSGKGEVEIGNTSLSEGYENLSEEQMFLMMGGESEDGEDDWDEDDEDWTEDEDDGTIWIDPVDVPPPWGGEGKDDGDDEDWYEDEDEEWGEEMGVTGNMRVKVVLEEVKAGDTDITAFRIKEVLDVNGNLITGNVEQYMSTFPRARVPSSGFRC